MPFFRTCERKVQGEWGGSAHSPDPTAQSAPEADAAQATPGAVRPGVPGGSGGAGWGVGVCCLRRGRRAGRRALGAVLAELEGSPPGATSAPCGVGVPAVTPPLPGLLGDPESGTSPAPKAARSGGRPLLRRRYALRFPRHCRGGGSRGDRLARPTGTSYPSCSAWRHLVCGPFGSSTVRRHTSGRCNATPGLLLCSG